MKVACGPATGSARVNASTRCANVRCAANIRDAEPRVAPHQSQLAKLREALKTSSGSTDATTRTKQVEDTLNKLQERWRESDEDAAVELASEREAPRNTGVRRVGDAMEYDFSVYREPGDDSDDEGEAEGGQRGPTIPREMKYFDTASINVKAGNGGSGCCAFRREKFVDHGGPSGGNGGDGGSVWAIADEGMNALTPFRNTVHWKAQDGVNGQGKDMHGANAKDTFVKVPMGTIIRLKGDPDAKPLAELLHAGDKALLVQGGRKGRGNASFKTGKNKAPIIAEEGEEGAALWIELELKLVADAGIIGVPNAGKSTLLSVLSDARPKIANYPFTTLVPNLGVCEMDYQTTVFADVPGILEGAHLGHGLGHEFLRHCSRSRVLVHVIDGTSPDPLYDYKAIRMELRMFNSELARKPQVIAYNKIDVPDSGDYADDMKELLVSEFGVDPDLFVPISAVSGEGVLTIVRKVREVLAALPEVEVKLETDAINQQIKTRTTVDKARLDDFRIESELAEERVWYVTGDALLRFAQMTNWDYFEAVLRFQKVLQACGVTKSLVAQGIMEGDSVVLGDVEFSWSDDQTDGALYEAWIDDMNGRGKVGKGSARWPHVAG